MSTKIYGNSTIIIVVFVSCKQGKVRAPPSLLVAPPPSPRGKPAGAGLPSSRRWRLLRYHAGFRYHVHFLPNGHIAYRGFVSLT